jgi:hypothetical protein
MTNASESTVIKIQSTLVSDVIEVVTSTYKVENEFEALHLQ